MSDTSNYYGDVVNVNSGEKVIGINHGTVVHDDGTAQDTELQAP
ncbi:hypothetical protein [Streptomyces sp. T028]